MNITLLDSYVNLDGRCVPETSLAPNLLYAAMASGAPVSTSQASVFERHQCYEKILSLFNRALYLCVGSAFTGNYQTVCDWKEKNDPQNRLIVMDTGSASGRLGLLAMSTAKFSVKAEHPDQVEDYARRASEQCEEYIFLECLKYLAAGGRMSKTGSFFGDFFKFKPVVSPLPQGVKKVGIARSSQGQLRLLQEKMEKILAKKELRDFLVQYTDNRIWVEETVVKTIQDLCPEANVMVRPLSITTGCHTGPGTWAIAFLPVIR